MDATEPKWAQGYRMYSYVTQELPALLRKHAPALDLFNASIMGHSMGGHGALVLALRNPGAYKSVSAFAPIANPMNCEWGKKGAWAQYCPSFRLARADAGGCAALGGYLGSDQELWKAYDATELVKRYDAPPLQMLIDVGTGDQFYNVRSSASVGGVFASGRSWERDRAVRAEGRAAAREPGGSAARLWRRHQPDTAQAGGLRPLLFLDGDLHGGPPAHARQGAGLLNLLNISIGTFVLAVPETARVIA